MDPILRLPSVGQRRNYKVGGQAASTAWRSHSRPVKGLIDLFAKHIRKSRGFDFGFDYTLYR